MVERRDAEAARIDAANAAQAAANVAAELAAAPTRLLAGLRARGVVLALDGKDRITAPGGTSLTASELETLAAHKPAILALLRAEREAAAPVVVA
jgi:hypothetical protein